MIALRVHGHKVKEDLECRDSLELVCANPTFAPRGSRHGRLH